MVFSRPSLGRRLGVLIMGLSPANRAIQTAAPALLCVGLVISSQHFGPFELLAAVLALFSWFWIDETRFDHSNGEVTHSRGLGPWAVRRRWAESLILRFRLEVRPAGRWALVADLRDEPALVLDVRSGRRGLGKLTEWGQTLASEWDVLFSGGGG